MKEVIIIVIIMILYIVLLGVLLANRDKFVNVNLPPPPKQETKQCIDPLHPYSNNSSMRPGTVCN